MKQKLTLASARISSASEVLSAGTKIHKSMLLRLEVPRAKESKATIANRIQEILDGTTTAKFFSSVHELYSLRLKNPWMKTISIREQKISVV